MLPRPQETVAAVSFLSFKALGRRFGPIQRRHRDAPAPVCPHPLRFSFASGGNSWQGARCKNPQFEAFLAASGLAVRRLPTPEHTATKLRGYLSAFAPFFGIRESAALLHQPRGYATRRVNLALHRFTGTRSLFRDELGQLVMVVVLYHARHTITTRPYHEREMHAESKDFRSGRI